MPCSALFATQRLSPALRPPKSIYKRLRPEQALPDKWLRQKALIMIFYLWSPFSKPQNFTKTVPFVYLLYSMIRRLFFQPTNQLMKRHWKIFNDLFTHNIAETSSGMLLCHLYQVYLRMHSL